MKLLGIFLLLVLIGCESTTNRRFNPDAAGIARAIEVADRQKNTWGRRVRVVTHPQSAESPRAEWLAFTNSKSEWRADLVELLNSQTACWSTYCRVPDSLPITFSADPNRPFRLLGVGEKGLNAGLDLLATGEKVSVAIEMYPGTERNYYWSWEPVPNAGSIAQPSKEAFCYSNARILKCHNTRSVREAVLKSGRTGSNGDEIPLDLASDWVSTAVDTVLSEPDLKWSLFIAVPTTSSRSSKFAFELKDYTPGESAGICGVVVKSPSGTPFYRRHVCVSPGRIESLAVWDSGPSLRNAVGSIAAAPIAVVGATVMLAAGVGQGGPAPKKKDEDTDE